MLVTTTPVGIETKLTEINDDLTHANDGGSTATSSSRRHTTSEDMCEDTHSAEDALPAIQTPLSTTQSFYPNLRVDNLPRAILDMEYAVRGEIVTRSWEIRSQLKDHPETLPFSEIVFGHIGNPQSVGQTPITFLRQVLSCLLYPSNLDGHDAARPETCTRFPPDVVSRVHMYLASVPAIGAYSHSQGAPLFREIVAEWLTQRDAMKADPATVFLSDGASAGIRMFLELLIRDKNDGIMVPSPEYPLYSATITRLGGTQVFYTLNEEEDWALSIGELESSILEARNKGLTVRAIVLINPGNPTGAILTRDNISQILSFASKEGLVVLADEVYQQNVWDKDCEWISVRRVMGETGTRVELASFHSASKGFWGECGIRAGLMQLEHVDPGVIAQLYKLASVTLCANTVGQALMATVVSPPVPGDNSFELYRKEKQEILDSLGVRARLVHEALNQIPGVTCRMPSGALYAFPRLELPRLACEAAKAQGRSPDAMYCMEMFEQTGYMTVPGSGFGQKQGSFHFRTTILPSEEVLRRVLSSVAKFHKTFIAKYQDC